jgi:DNA-binding sugar fermentation-stimulating protein
VPLKTKSKFRGSIADFSVDSCEDFILIEVKSICAAGVTVLSVKFRE